MCKCGFGLNEHVKSGLERVFLWGRNAMCRKCDAKCDSCMGL